MKVLTTILLAACLLSGTGCSPCNKDELKDKADAVWKQQGFELVAYEGYEWGMGIGSYGGARVWHRLKKIPDNGITYSGSLQKWGKEIHVYGPVAIEVLKPNQ